MTSISTKLKQSRYAALSLATTIAVSIPMSVNAQQAPGTGLFGAGEKRLNDVLSAGGNADPGLAKFGGLIFGILSVILFIFAAALVVNAIKESSNRGGDTDWTGILVGVLVFILGLVFITFASKQLFGA
jgi:hypothetical protein